jgi:RibD C-terminal domain
MHGTVIGQVRPAARGDLPGRGRAYPTADSGPSAAHGSITRGKAGGQSALSRSRLRPQASRASVHHHAGRHDIPLCHRQYLRAGHIDEMHLSMSPVLLGCGEHLFADIDMNKLGFERTEHVATANATHVVLTRRR